MKEVKMEPIYITGAGIVSAIGLNKDDSLAALFEKKSGIDQIRYLAGEPSVIPVGEVKMSNQEMAKRLGCHSDSNVSRSILIGRMALCEALVDASLSMEEIHNAHFISSTTTGNMDKRERVDFDERDYKSNNTIDFTHSFAYQTQKIGEWCGPFASLATISTACSSSTNAIIMGANMLRLGLAEIVVVGGTDCLTRFHLNGFDKLMILDHHPCRPFDKNRDGLNLGEGAAYLVLETASSAKRREKRPLCILQGYGNACDAFHQTASSPSGEGAFLAMQKALEMSDLTQENIHYINAHGTGTINNDKSEINAFRRLFGNSVPPLSSTKSFTGHTMGASGSIEAVICILALQHQFLPVNLNWQTPMEDDIRPVTDIHPQALIQYIMSNAYGFGGNCSSIILSKYDG